jgi:DNA gyrase/topoisomerase IV subunit B
VVNALSERLKVEVKRDGYRWSQDFILGDPVAPLERLEESDETGTIITFYASHEIFETTVYSYDTLAARFREMAFLNKGLTITIVDERPDRKDGEGNAYTDTFRYDDGLIDYVKYLTGTKETVPQLGHRGRGRAARQRDQRRSRNAVEHVVHGVGAHVREHHQHARGRHPRGGLPVGAHLHRERLGPDLGHDQED